WLQSTPYLVEHDLTARIAHTELGGGHHADGGPLDPLLHEAEQARAVPPFRGEQLDLHELAPAITAPTLVLTGTQDLISPPRIAHDLAARIPGARLLEVPGARHSILDTRSRILQVAARWSACATAHRLPERAEELAALPAARPVCPRPRSASPPRRRQPTPAPRAPPGPASPSPPGPATRSSTPAAGSSRSPPAGAPAGPRTGCPSGPRSWPRCPPRPRTSRSHAACRSPWPRSGCRPGGCAWPRPGRSASGASARRRRSIPARTWGVAAASTAPIRCEDRR